MNMFLGSSVYSVEWAFLGFIFITVLFYDFKIDSRFLILPALLLLGYLPFILMARYDPLAEQIAIYVYYFLVVGVFLQLAEHLQKTKNSLDFDRFIKEIVDMNWFYPIITTGIITIIIIVLNRFMNLEFWKWTFVYLFVVSLVFELISYLKE
jgi:hypothetical protein